MASIFISYRREDTESTTGRIYERLAKEYGKASVMMDIDNIPYGVDFRNYLQEQLAECEVMIAVVGTKWLGPRRGRQPRINDDSDWIRLEIETALKRNIPLIPALVHSARMPKADSVPKSIVDFCFRHAAIVSTGQDFHNHLDRLIESLNRTLVSRRTALAQTRPVTSVQTPWPALVQKRATSSNESPPQSPSFESPRDRHLFGPNPKRILSLDGGGLRSFATIAFLERIQSILSQQSGKESTLASQFDLIGGTSTGGIIASLLALDYRMVDIKAAFLEVTQSLKTSLWRLLGLRARFDKRQMFEGLDRLLGDRSLGSLDLVTGLCLVMKRLDNGQVWLVVNNPRLEQWDTPDDFSYVGQRHFQLARLVRATSAMPGYFDPEVIALGKTQVGIFVDGGTSVHNNPSLALFMMAASSNGGLSWPTGPDRIKIVSVGAASYRTKFALSELGGWAAPLKQGLYSLYSLQSMAEEIHWFVLEQMQALGTSRTPWAGNTINGLEVFPQLGDPQFQFVRYDLHLDQRWLVEHTGIKLTEKDVTRLHKPTDSGVARDLYEIARTAAECQVKPDHFIDSNSG
jgi:predicted acylesterase/phospholipase RssA